MKKLWHKLSKKLQIVLAVMGILVVMVVIWFLFSLIPSGSTKVKTSEFEVKEIREINALAITYDKTVDETSNQAKAFGFFKIGSKERDLYIFHFKAKMYYDMAKVNPNTVGNTITYTLPKAKVDLLLAGDNFITDYEIYKLKDAFFVLDANDKGLEVQTKAVSETTKEIRTNEAFIKQAQDSAREFLTSLYSDIKDKENKIKVVVNFN
ncbi:DUF4230 domain-containing protein [Pseudolactococcus yaeyamensis]